MLELVSMKKWVARGIVIVFVVIGAVAGISLLESKPRGSLEIVSMVAKEGLRGTIASPVATQSVSWTAFSSLHLPPSRTQISFWPEGSYVLAFNYDGSIPEGRVLSKADPHYPDDNTIRLTAFLHSSLEVQLPPLADIATLEVSTDGSFVKDKNHVFYSDCEGLACGYNMLIDADPGSFEQLDLRNQYSGDVAARDRKHSYSCTPVQCTELLMSD